MYQIIFRDPQELNPIRVMNCSTGNMILAYEVVIDSSSRVYHADGNVWLETEGPVHTTTVEE